MNIFLLETTPGQFQKLFKTSVTVNLTEKSKALNKVTKSHTMLAQDSLLGSLLFLPVELQNGIAV